MKGRRSRLMRVHISFYDQINNMYRQRQGDVSKVNITKNIASAITGQRRNGIDIDFWPFPKRIKLRKEFQI